MCKELEEELNNGSELAAKLAEHLNNMGAGKLEIPITLDSGCYLIKVVKTL